MGEEKTYRCEKCGLPVAKIVGGTLVIESRHHGEKHVNTIAITELVELAKRQLEKLGH